MAPTPLLKTILFAIQLFTGFYIALCVGQFFRNTPYAIAYIFELSDAESASIKSLICDAKEPTILA